MGKHAKKSHRVRVRATSNTNFGRVISLEELLSRSGLDSALFEYAVEWHLIPGAVRVSGKGSERGGARYVWATGHGPYCDNVAKVRKAGGSYAIVALRLLTTGLALPTGTGPWIKRALREFILHRFGEGATLGAVRSRLRSKRITPRSVTRAVIDPEAYSDEDAYRLRLESRAGGVERALQVRAALARNLYGRAAPEDNRLPDLSWARLLDVLDAVADDTLVSTYNGLRGLILPRQKGIAALMGMLPQMSGYTREQAIQEMYPFYDLFKGTSLARALLPLLLLVSLVVLAEPEAEARSHADVLAALLDMPLPGELPPDLPENAKTAAVTALPCAPTDSLVQSP